MVKVGSVYGSESWIEKGKRKEVSDLLTDPALDSRMLEDRTKQVCIGSGSR